MTLPKPPNWPLLDDPEDWGSKHLMSNFDHEVDQDVAQELRNNQAMAKYAGWNFNADCWFADGQFHAAVHVYGVHRATVSADTPEALMELVSNTFGWD